MQKNKKWKILGMQPNYELSWFWANFEPKFRFLQETLMDMMLSILPQSKSMLPISMIILRFSTKNHMLDKLPNIPHQVRYLLHRLFQPIGEKTL